MRTLFMTLCITFMTIGGPIFIARGQHLSDAKRIRIEKEIDAIFQTMITAAEQLDVDKLNEGVDDRYHAGFITNGNYYSGFDALMNNFRSRVQGINSQKITIKTKKITVLTENLALITATGETLVDLAERESLTAHFFWSFVYQKIDNDWKVIQSHQSNTR